MLTQRLLQEEIAQVVNLVQFIGARVPLRLSGRSYRGQCPLHQDDGRELYVYPGLDKWRCFACNTGGGVVDFLMKIDNLCYGEALRKLGVEYGFAPERLGFGSASPDDHAGGRASQFPNRTAFSDIVREHATEATDDIEEHLTRLRQGIRQIVSRRRRDESPAGLYRQVRRPMLGNLAVHKGLQNPPFRTVVSDVQSGLVIVIFQNLQPHLMLEQPSASISIVDTQEYVDAGEIIWAARGTALIKNLKTGDHSEEVEINAITKSGFALLRPPGQRHHAWFGPRFGGQNRPTYLTDGSILAMESLSMDADVLRSYVDLAGVSVRLQAPERSASRHRDYLVDPATDPDI
jgi:hypothetical protein